MCHKRVQLINKITVDFPKNGVKIAQISMKGVFSVNIIAFLFAFAGVAFNVFQPVISVPASGSVFTGSMYDAFVVMANYIGKNGLPGGEGAAGAILIFMVLCLVPVVAAVQGLCALFRRGRHVRMSLFLCALVDGLVAAGIYYVSPESFSSAFFTNYIMPYAQKIPFITPAVWAVCYLLASVFAVPTSKPEPLPVNNNGPLSLKKGEVINLGKGLSKLYVGLGWTIESEQYDLDASAFVLAANDRVVRDEDFIFYGNKAHDSGAVIVGPDNRGGGSGRDDDESIDVDLTKVPAYVGKIAFVVTIHEAERRGQNFGQIRSAFIRVVDMVNEREILRYDLREKFSAETAVIAGELRRDSGNSWRFEAKGEGIEGGLVAVCRKYGVNASY